jgi:hypothetical protein
MGKTVAFFVVCLIGYMSIHLLVEEIKYSVHGRQVVAKVEQFSKGKDGAIHADVVYDEEGTMLRGRLNTYSWLYAVAPGDEVPILYLPENPGAVHLDSFWRRYFWPVGLILFAGFFLICGVRSLFVPRRRAPAE